MTIPFDDPIGDAEDVAVIRPQSRLLEIDFKQLWRFRDLLFALAWRDIRLRYRQTALGVAWVVLQPLLGAAIFTVVFGLIARMPSGGAPYFVISFAGLIGWTLFSSTVTRVSASIVANAELIRKVYFPRLLLPLGILPSTLLDFAFGAGFMAVLMAIYRIAPDSGLLLLPVCAFILLALALGLGMIAGSFAVEFRDVQYIVPLFIQLMMYASPVGYSANAVPAYLRPVYDLNPLVAPVEAMRWSLLGIGQLDVRGLAYSAGLAAALLAIGLAVFRLKERRFADVI